LALRPIAHVVLVVALLACRARTPEEVCAQRWMGYAREADGGGRCVAPGFCQAPCDVGWALLPQLCKGDPAGEVPEDAATAAPPAADDPARGSIAGTVGRYPGGSSRGHDFSLDATPAAGQVVTASAGVIDHAVPELSAITGPEGHYRISNLAPGTYHVLVLDSCNHAVGQDGVVVEAGTTVIVGLKYPEDFEE